MEFVEESHHPNQNADHIKKQGCNYHGIVNFMVLWSWVCEMRMLQQVWRVEVFWFPRVETWERREGDGQTENNMPLDKN